MENEEIKKEELDQLIKALGEAISDSKRMGKIIENKQKLAYRETSVLRVEERKKEFENLETERVEFDEMTAAGLARASKKIEKYQENRQKEYQEKLLDIANRKKVLEDKYTRLKERGTSPEKVKMIEDAYENNLNKIDIEMKDFQDNYSKEAKELDNWKKQITDWVKEINCENKFYEELDKIELEFSKEEEEELREEGSNGGKELEKNSKAGKELEEGSKAGKEIKETSKERKESEKNPKQEIVISYKGVSINGKLQKHDNDSLRYDYADDSLGEKGRDAKAERCQKLGEKLEEFIGEKGSYRMMNYADRTILAAISKSEDAKNMLQEYYKNIKGEESDLKITYDLRGLSLFNRMKSIFSENPLEKQQIKELKEEAYHAKGYAEIKAGIITKMQFKIRETIERAKQKRLTKGQEEESQSESKTQESHSWELSKEEKAKANNRSQPVGETKEQPKIEEKEETR